MADSAHSLQAGEKSLYASQDGQVLVSDRRLVLGSESWNMTEIADVDAVARKEMRFGNWLKPTRATWTTIGIGVACLLLSVLSVALAVANSGFVFVLGIGLAMILFLVGIGFCIVAWLQSVPDVYSLQITVQDPAGGQRQYRAAYTWTDRLQAREVEQAVLEAMVKK